MPSRSARASSPAEAGAVNLARLEQARGLAGDFRAELPKRREIVENPERASVRSRDQVTFLYRKIVNGNHRQISPQGLPVGAIIERYPYASLRARGEQA